MVGGTQGAGCVDLLDEGAMGRGTGSKWPEARTCLRIGEEARSKTARASQEEEVRWEARGLGKGHNVEAPKSRYCPSVAILL